MSNLGVNPTASTAIPIPRPRPADLGVPYETHSVQQGESLWKIAESQLGSGARWGELYELNKDLIGSNPNLIKPGTELRIRPLTPAPAPVAEPAPAPAVEPSPPAADVVSPPSPEGSAVPSVPLLEEPVEPAVTVPAAPLETVPVEAAPLEPVPAEPAPLVVPPVVPPVVEAVPVEPAVPEPDPAAQAQAEALLGRIDNKGFTASHHGDPVGGIPQVARAMTELLDLYNSKQPGAFQPETEARVESWAKDILSARLVRAGQRFDAISPANSEALTKLLTSRAFGALEPERQDSLVAGLRVNYDILKFRTNLAPAHQQLLDTLEPLVTRQPD